VPDACTFSVAEFGSGGCFSFPLRDVVTHNTTIWKTFTAET